MGLEVIKPTKIYEEIVEKLKSAIFNGEFPPGTRLPSVRVLSQQFGVGQAAVREALTALQALGLITLKQGGGTYVNHFDPELISKKLEAVPLLVKQDLLHLLELRKIIETGTTRLAAKRRTEEDLNRIGSALAKMEQDVENARAIEQSDWEFHYSIAQATKNPFLLSLMDTIAEKIQSSLIENLQQLHRIPGSLERILQEHRSILHAIQLGDQREAEERMLLHLMNVEEFLQGEKEGRAE